MRLSCLFLPQSKVMLDELMFQGRDNAKVFYVTVCSRVLFFDVIY